MLKNRIKTDIYNKVGSCLSSFLINMHTSLQMYNWA